MDFDVFPILVESMRSDESRNDVKERNPTTVRAITSSIGTLTVVASLKVCGSKSSKEVVISTPAAKVPRTPMFLLRLAAKVPPNNVEKQVTMAKRTALKFI